MKYANTNEQTKLTKAIVSITDQREALEQARRNFANIVFDVMKRVGTIESDVPRGEDAVLELLDEDIVFKKMEYLPENGGEVLVTGYRTDNLAIEVVTPLKDIFNPEALFSVL